jgi:hypothetical protein
MRYTYGEAVDPRKSSVSNEGNGYGEKRVGSEGLSVAA